MKIGVCFYSYFKDLTGVPRCEEELPAGATIALLLARLHTRYPRLAAMSKSTLVAVGVDYQRPDYVLQPGDEVSLFPPVQGG